MEFLSYFSNVFEPVSFLILCIGTIGGLILGAIPGLSPTMAVALLIPFTFNMSPSQGLVLLGAAYTATVAGGAVSAILLGIPGAPSNIATTLDGHKMAKNGEATKALHMCFISSGIGGIFGILVLIFLTPLLARWALGFGPSQLFWISILGITIIGSLDSNSPLKGLLGGFFGMWISTIGYDSIRGVERFVFSSHVEGGINVIAALIGAFAIPQIINMFSSGRKYKRISVISRLKTSVLSSALEVFSKFRALILGSVIGTIIGIIPGVGGQIAGIVAYDQAKKFSPRADNFGKGESEGVVAAETSNNAMVGPSLIPLLTLGVPGSPTAAVLLGGLLIHGIAPGPDLFQKHPEVIWTFIDSMLIAQVLMVIFGIMIAGVAASVVRIPTFILAPAIFLFAIFGSYSVQNSVSDMIIMFSLGLLVYFLSHFGFNPAVIVLGLILGPIAERNYVQSYIIANAGDGLLDYLFNDYLNMVIIFLCLVSVGYSFSSFYRSYRKF